MIHILLFALSLGCGGAESEPDEPPVTTETYLSVSPLEFELSGSNAVKTVAVTATAAWTVVTDAAWLTCTPAGGAAPGGNVTVSAISNVSGSRHTATLTFTATRLSSPYR